MQVNLEQNEQTEWLVVFLILDSLDIRNWVGELFNQVKTIPLQPKNKVYFLKDSISRIIMPVNDPAYRLSLNELVYNEATGETQLIPKELKDVDPHDGFAWREALVQICRTTKPSFSTLITWSHGAGVGIFNPQTNQLGIEFNNFNLIRNYKALHNFFDKDRFNCTTLQTDDTIVIPNPINNDVNCPGLANLFISDIAHGLKGEHVFDLVAMCNCHTQMVDNCYNLNGVARTYLAPITAIQVNGYDFAGFLDTINKGIIPDPNFKNIGQLFLDGYKKLNPSLERDSAIIFNDLTAILQLKPLLNNICNFFERNFALVYPVIENVLADNVAFSEKDFVDLVLLFDRIQAGLQANAEFDKVYDQFKAVLLNSITIAAHIGDKLSLNRFHCFSIYIPVHKNLSIDPVFCCQYFRCFGNSQFVQELDWDNFVVRFAQFRANPNAPQLPPAPCP